MAPVRGFPIFRVVQMETVNHRPARDSKNYSWSKWVTVLLPAVLGYVFRASSFFFLTVVVSLWDGDSVRTTTGTFYCGLMSSSSSWTRWPRSLQAPLVLTGIEGIRSDGVQWLGLQPAARSTSDAVPCSLYSHSQPSCRPQPRGSGGDATPRKDTTQNLLIVLPPPRIVAVFFRLFQCVSRWARGRKW